jgi:hypothetical protein
MSLLAWTPQQTPTHLLWHHDSCFQQICHNLWSRKQTFRLNSGQEDKLDPCHSRLSFSLSQMAGVLKHTNHYQMVTQQWGNVGMWASASALQASFGWFNSCNFLTQRGNTLSLWPNPGIVLVFGLYLLVGEWEPWWGQLVTQLGPSKCSQQICLHCISPYRLHFEVFRAVVVCTVGFWVTLVGECHWPGTTCSLHLQDGSLSLGLYFIHEPAKSNSYLESIYPKSILYYHTTYS